MWRGLCIYPCVFIQAHISHLKEVLVARDEEVAGLTMQNKSCQCQLAEAHGHIVELEARLVSSYLSHVMRFMGFRLPTVLVL